MGWISNISAYFSCSYIVQIYVFAGSVRHTLMLTVHADSKGSENMQIDVIKLSSDKKHHVVWSVQLCIQVNPYSEWNDTTI